MSAVEESFFNGASAIAGVTFLDDDYLPASKEGVPASIECTVDGEAVGTPARNSDENNFASNQPQEMRYRSTLPKILKKKRSTSIDLPSKA